MSFITSSVISTVNTSYVDQVTLESLVQKINDIDNIEIDCYVIAFLTEVSLKFQCAFIEEMNIPMENIKKQSIKYSKLFGYKLILSI